MLPACNHRDEPVADAEPPGPTPEDSGVTLDARELRGRITDRDGDLVCLLDDGDVEIEVQPGVGGDAMMAVYGAQRAAHALTQYAAELRRRIESERAGVPPVLAPVPAGLSDELPRGKVRE